MIEYARIRIGAGARHQVYRVEAAERGILALGALRPLLIVFQRERHHLAFFYQLRRRDNVLGGSEIQRADFVVLAPAAPVFVFLRRRMHILAREFAIFLFARVEGFGHLRYFADHD